MTVTKTIKKRLVRWYYLLIMLVMSLHSQAVVKSKTLNQALTPQDSIVSMLLGLLAILVVIFILAFLFRKVAHFNLVGKNIKVIESQSLGAKERLVVVEIQNQQILLGVTPHSINHLCQLDKPIEKSQSQMPFEKILKQLTNPLAEFEKAKQRAYQQSDPLTDKMDSARAQSTGSLHNSQANQGDKVV
ncbi:flagellar biosynthetic protein FliO [Aliikangiella maris]|uniref:Flagellar biosynthetic protein FliO n=2 Tax=Aliikangiella maris TaxID=3162458 RepID=A0ABV3MMZ5_9GAMM